MAEDNNEKIRSRAENIEQVLQERERLDKILKERFTKKMTIVFSDVSGYTKYMDTWGDIRGRAWIQKHHDMVFPIIEEYNGTILDIMGDGLMVSFTDPRAAVKACVRIQESLYKYNQNINDADELHVHVGINVGEILVDDDHIAGDVVNVASRIQSQAVADQILLSKSAYEEICESDDFLCRFHDKVEVKGKAEQLELYRVIWKDEDVLVSAEPVVRSGEAKVSDKAHEVQRVLHLEVQREGERLKISANEHLSGESSTVRHYEEIPVPMEKIGSRCQEVVDTLNKANRRGHVSRDIFMKFRGIGQVFSDDLFTHGVKEKIRSTKAEHLTISLDDQLVQIPWELLHDGKEFLCQRFSMGRLVRTRQNLIGTGVDRALARPLKMLILADPKGDLNGAYAEGTELCNFIDDEKTIINATLRSGNITTDFLREKIRNFDFVHFAGHSDYDQKNPGESGWRLTEGNLKAHDIIKMAGINALPSLIFSNACQSARTEEWGVKKYFHDEIFGMANAFVLAGVKHYIGTFWEILDEPSKKLALQFYRHLIAGKSTGEALRLARLTLIEEYGEETIVWASYLLYGDPTFNYMAQIKALEEPDHQERVSAKVQESSVRATEDVIDFSTEDTGKKFRFVWPAVAGILILIAALIWGYPKYINSQAEKYEASALSFYNGGDYDNALTACKTLEEKSPARSLAYLIQGDIALRQGNTRAAEAAYRKAHGASKGTESQKARALMGLGRIASIQNRTDQALKLYRQSSEISPAGGASYLARAMVMNRSGNAEGALGLLDKAYQLSPDNPAIASLAEETRKKVLFSKDREKKARIGKLVKELIAKMESAPEASPYDGWTSRTLTLWIMDFTVKGYSLEEGQERLLISGITDNMIRKSRVQMVERELLDTLLEELKLSTSKLISRSTALSLGKIIAARLVLFGQLTYSGPQTQVTVRMVETETGRIIGAVSETFGGTMPAGVLSDKLSEMLIQKINRHYPVRGRIVGMENNQIKLDIGSNEGVRDGLVFNVRGEDTRIEVTMTQPDTSVAKMIRGEKVPDAGQQVEAL